MNFVTSTNRLPLLMSLSLRSHALQRGREAGPFLQMVSASTSSTASALLARSFLSSVSEWIQKRAFHGGDGSQQRCKRDLGIVVAEQMLEYRIWQVW